MNKNLAAFLRGLAYALIGGALDFVANHIGASGLVSASTAVLITGFIASVEQYLNTANDVISSTTTTTTSAPTTPSSTA